MKFKNIKFFYEKLPLAPYLACRRLLPKSRTPGASLLPKLAFLSIMVGVAASVLILSLTNGLHNNYLERLAEQDAHITLLAPGKGIPAYQEIAQKIQNISGIVQVFPYSQNEALIKYYDETTGIVLKSYPSYFKNDAVFTKIFQLIQGSWSFDKTRSITIGNTFSKNMGLFVGDYIEILVYDNVLGAVTYRFKIAGIFAADDALLDKGVAFINFNDAAEIFGFEGYAPYLGIRVRDYFKPEKYLKILEQTVPFHFKTWRASNLNTLLALNNEKQIIRVLLLVFFCVAFFGILAVMTALVADKREETALLKALGMTPQENSYSFLLTGLFLGISASIIGLILGIFISLNFNNIIFVIEWIINTVATQFMLLLKQPPPPQFTFLNQSVYYLKKFPILIKTADLLFSFLLAVLCTLTAAIYPAQISKNFRPAEILRKRAV